MAMTWLEAAELCEDKYGVYVDVMEEFFHCIECDDPILKEDWEGHDFSVCPICGFSFLNDEYEEEE